MVYTTVVTNCLLSTLRLMRGSPRMWRYGKVAECICICSALAFPFAYFWILIVEGYHLPVCEGIQLSRTDTIGTIFSAIYAALSVEILFVSITVCSFFCALRRRLQSRQLISLLKHLLCYTLANSTLVIYSALFNTL